MGMCANSLELGCDCLGLIHYFDAHLCTSRGEPLTIKNAICMHEEDYGILWKHTDRRLPDTPEVRRSRRLVDFVDLDGRELRVRLLLVSVPGRQHPVRGQADRHPVAGRAAARRDAEVRQPGRAAALRPESPALLQRAARLRPRRRGQHGPAGRRRGRRARAEAIRSRTPSRRRPTLLKTEKQARAHLNLETARTWKIVNPNVRNAVGEPVGYKFMPGDNSFPFASPNAWWRKRAGFVNHHVWVTPYRDDEKYGAGDYPEPEPRRRRPDPLDRAGPADREHRRRALVHLRPHAHPAAGGLPGDADGVHRLHCSSRNGFFTENPANDVPAVGEEAERGVERERLLPFEVALRRRPDQPGRQASVRQRDAQFGLTLRAAGDRIEGHARHRWFSGYPGFADARRRRIGDGGLFAGAGVEHLAGPLPAALHAAQAGADRVGR